MSGTRGRRAPLPGFALLVAIVALALAACGGEDRPGSVAVIGDGSTSGSASGAGVSGSGSGTVSGAPPGVVSPPPADVSAELTVELTEWAIEPSLERVPAGPVYVLADNVGPDDPHEVLAVPTDLPVDGLPVDERGLVLLGDLKSAGRVGPFAPGGRSSGVFDLPPGRYVLICNIVEFEEGEWESHYLEGMYAELFVD